MSQSLTYADIAEHKTKKDLYMVVHDKVYNASNFVDEHPYVSFPSISYTRHPCRPARSREKEFLPRMTTALPALTN